MKHIVSGPRARWLLAAALVVAVVAGGITWHHLSGRESTDDAQIDGTILSISPRVGGTVTAVSVTSNQPVDAGDLLVTIDPADYRIAVERAEAEYEAAQGALEAARAGVPLASSATASGLSKARAGLESARSAQHSAEQEVAAARARLDAAKARAEQATSDLERLKSLVAKQEVPQQQYDAAHSQATAADAAVAEAEQGVAIAESHERQAASAVTSAQAAVRKAESGPQEVTASKGRLTTAEARVKQAKAVLDRARLDLERTRITAPVAGVVSKKSVEVGETVRADQPLMALVPLHDVWVTANFKETQLRHMRPGQRAEVKVDAYGRTYQGTVESIAPATGAKFSLLPAENASGNFVKVVQRVPVKIVLDALEQGSNSGQSSDQTAAPDSSQTADRLLRPGMSVEATVLIR